MYHVSHLTFILIILGFHHQKCASLFYICLELVLPFFTPSLGSLVYSRAITIASLWGTLRVWPFFECLLLFSSFLLRLASSTFLISPAFFIGLGTCLCFAILRISGICLYLSLRALSYSSLVRSRAERTCERWEASARQSRTFPSSDPERI